jgi:ACS family tartrate transporter-like MFS transporter
MVGKGNRLTGAQGVDEAEAIGRSALRKATWRLVPLIGLGYGAAYIDRVNISFAALQMNRDLHFSASIYGFGAGIFFLSYALCELPSNLLLVRFGARRWLARIMLTWGLIAMGMVFVRTPHQFYALRFLLGMAEAGFFPGVVFYLTEWFPPEYRARTISRFYIALPLSSTVMGSLAGWLLGLNGRLRLAGWQWLFLLEGVPPLLLSWIFLRFLPDTPADAKWLTAPERAWLGARQAGIVHEKATPAHTSADVLQVLCDPRTWWIAGFLLFQLTVLYAWSFSAPEILQSLTALSAGAVGWLLAGMGLLGAVAMLWNSADSDRRGERTWHIVVPCLVMAAGYAVGGATRIAWLAVPAFALTVMAFNAMQGPVYTLPASFLSGRLPAIGYGVVSTLAIGGGFVGPYWMGRARDLTGDYQRGLMTLAVPSLLAAGLILALRIERANNPRTG